MAVMGASVLLVEDEAPIADVLARNLRARGYEVRVETSGQDGLYALTESVPDVLVLDINLPDITGWEVLRRLSPADRSRVPVIVFSASPLAPSRVQEFKPAGVLIKPFPVEALLRLIDEATSNRREVRGA
jgi:two-component system phosphate regulon response regulator PhoB